MHPFKNAFTISSGLCSVPVYFNNSSFMPRAPWTEIKEFKAPTSKPTVHQVNHILSWSVVISAIQTYTLVAAQCKVKIWADCRDRGAGENTLRQESFNQTPTVASSKFFHCLGEHNATVFHWSKIDKAYRRYVQKGKEKGVTKRCETFINHIYSLYFSVFNYSKQYQSPIGKGLIWVYKLEGVGSVTEVRGEQLTASQSTYASFPLWEMEYDASVRPPCLIQNTLFYPRPMLKLILRFERHRLKHTVTQAAQCMKMKTSSKEIMISSSGKLQG